MLSSSFFFLTLASLASTRSILWDRHVPERRGWHVHERRDNAPTGFTYTGPAPPEQVIQFRIALTQNNPNGLIQALYNVSDPDHPQYGQHLSQDEVYSFFAVRDQPLTI
jgi:tripeptidyl-peptidase-1